MKTVLRLTLLLALIAMPVAGVADEDENDTRAKIKLGLWGADVNDSPDMVAEYEPTSGGPELGLMVNTHQDWGSLLVAAHGRHSDDANAELDFDVYRAIRSTTTYDKLLHRLGHDPMTNLEATSVNGKVVFHEDRDPFRDYDLRYSVLDHRTELQLPQLPGITVGVNYREQWKEGHRQAFATSHCDTCHVVSQTHKLNEKTSDFGMDAKIGWKGGNLRASVTGRQLRQGTQSLTFLYDDALHPELQVPVFDNRLQYDSAEGPQPVDLWPGIDKTISRLDLNLSDVAGFVINGQGVWSETENRYTKLKSTYTGYVVNAARAFGTMRLRWRGRAYTIDNDSVYVDTNERVGIAGPHAGLTYEDVYDINFDHVRLSSLNRDVIESKLDFSFRLGKKAGTLKLNWDIEAIDREHYQVLVGRNTTTTNILGLSWRVRPAKAWRVNAIARHAEIDAPYMLIDGACSTLESGSYPNPWNPETPQYHDFQDARVAETTASPSGWNELWANVSYVAGGSTTLTGSLRYWDGSNTDGDLTDWSRTNSSATLTLWSAPEERIDWYAAVAWNESELESPGCIPVFDG